MSISEKRKKWLVKLICNAPQGSTNHLGTSILCGHMI